MNGDTVKTRYIIDVDSQGLPVLRKTSDEFDRLDRRAATTGGTMDKLRKNWLALTGVIAGATLAMREVYQFGAKAVSAYLEQEEAENRLAVAMKNVGDYSTYAHKEMLQYAAGIQKTTAYGDEAVISMMANLKTYGMTTDELKKATGATLDLATAKKMDLVAASELVGKAFVGETGTLSRYGIIIDKNIERGDKFEAVLRQIHDRFGGSAQAEVDTYRGKWESISNTMGDWMEMAGKPIVEVLWQIVESIKTIGAEAPKTSESWGTSSDFLGLSLGQIGGAFEMAAYEVPPFTEAVKGAGDESEKTAKKIKILGRTMEDWATFRAKLIGEQALLAYEPEPYLGEDTAYADRVAQQIETEKAMKMAAYSDDYYTWLEWEWAKAETEREMRTQRADEYWQFLEEQIAMQQQAAAAEIGIRQQVADNIVAIFMMLGTKSKAFAIVGIAIATVMEMIRAYQATLTAATLAFASQLIPGDPSSLARAAAAAAMVKAWGMANVALIGAIGATRAALAAGGSAGAPGGGGGIYSPLTGAEIVEQEREEQRPISITVNISGNVVDHDAFARELIPSITRALDDGVH